MDFAVIVKKEFIPASIAAIQFKHSAEHFPTLTTQPLIRSVKIILNYILKYIYRQKL